MAATSTRTAVVGTGNFTVLRVVETAAANGTLAIMIAPGKAWRLMSVNVKYSTTVSKNITVTLDSGAGAAYAVS